MLTISIFEQIVNSRKQDNNSALPLLEKLSPLIHKYAHCLQYEDALEDLQLDFIILLQTICLAQLRNQTDPYLVSYLTVLASNCFSGQEQLFFYDLKRILSPKEFTVIYFVFYVGYTVKEISFLTKISVQAVNQTKNRALKKLKSSFDWG